MNLEEIAEWYDRVAEGIYEGKAMYVDTLKLAKDVHGQVLDVGCGQGRFLQLVQKRSPGATLHGCDISPRLIEIAGSNLPDADLRVCDAGTLAGFEDETFDYVFFVSSLEHMLDHSAALRAARRVLKPGGILVVSVPNRAWLLYDRWASHHEQRQPVDDYWFQPDELEALIRDAGFEVTKARGVWVMVRGGWRHQLENAAAFVVRPLHGKMKAIGMRAVAR